MVWIGCFACTRTTLLHKTFGITFFCKKRSLGLHIISSPRALLFTMSCFLQPPRRTTSPGALRFLCVSILYGPFVCFCLHIHRVRFEQFFFKVNLWFIYCLVLVWYTVYYRLRFEQVFKQEVVMEHLFVFICVSPHITTPHHAQCVYEGRPFAHAIGRVFFQGIQIFLLSALCLPCLCVCAMLPKHRVPGTPTRLLGLCVGRFSGWDTRWQWLGGA